MSLITLSNASADSLTVSMYSLCSAVRLGFQGKVGHPDDAIQGGANLMAHIGQEFALRPAGAFCYLCFLPGRIHFFRHERVLLAKLELHGVEREAPVDRGGYKYQEQDRQRTEHYGGEGKAGDIDGMGQARNSARGRKQRSPRPCPHSAPPE